MIVYRSKVWAAVLVLSAATPSGSLLGVAADPNLSADRAVQAVIDEIKSSVDYSSSSSSSSSSTQDEHYWHRILDAEPYQPPFINCLGGSLDVVRVGHPVCFKRGQGLCKDGFSFGIFFDKERDDYFLQLREDAHPLYTIYNNFKGAQFLCIGEERGNNAYLQVKFEGGVAWLVCPDCGNPNKLPKLKIRAQDDYDPSDPKYRNTDSNDDENADAVYLPGEKTWSPNTNKDQDKRKKKNRKKDNRMLKPDDFLDTIVKFRDGADDDDTIWEIKIDGTPEKNPKAKWILQKPQIPEEPSSSPSALPTTTPSALPTTTPSVQPSESQQPSTAPSSQPTSTPSSTPSDQPIAVPSSQPTSAPSSEPSVSLIPSASPTGDPSTEPSAGPTGKPSVSSIPSSMPSGHPSSSPSTSFSPTADITSRPSQRPTNQFSSPPSVEKSSRPSGEPSAQGSSPPSLAFSEQPSSATDSPSAAPSTSANSRFNIEIKKIGEITEGVQRQIDNAKAKLESVIVGDVPNFNNPGGADVFRGQFPGNEFRPSVVDDIVIGVEIRQIGGGILGQGGPLVLRNRNNTEGDVIDTLPVSGLTILDQDFVATLSETDLFVILLHEFSHCLGIGFLDCTGFARLDDCSANRNFAVPALCGNATREYADLLDGTLNERLRYEDIPRTGSGCAHWETDLFTSTTSSEYMTFAFDFRKFQPLTTVTVGGFNDIGYKVNYEKADPYPTNMRPMELMGARYGEVAPGMIPYVTQNIDFTKFEHTPEEVIVSVSDIGGYTVDADV